MGARSVNPKVTTRVVFINSWSDPALEAETIKTFKEGGIDVFTHQQDDQNSILNNAKSMHLNVIGCNADTPEMAPQEWLTGACLDWGPLYVKIARAVLEGKWISTAYSSGMEEGYIKLASFGRSVPESVRKEALAIKKKIEAGNLVFTKDHLPTEKGTNG